MQSFHLSLISRRYTILLALIASLALNACALRNPFAKESASAEKISPASGVVQVVKNEKLFGFVPIYRPDVQQGNFITQEMVAQLKNGMTKDQVRFLLGTPLLIDSFHENRLDYPFRLKNGDGQLTASRVVVFFENDKVAKFEGGDLPTEKDYLMRIAAPKKKINLLY
jgi:outer membrane protein assembly factor BamE